MTKRHKGKKRDTSRHFADVRDRRELKANPGVWQQQDQYPPPPSMLPPWAKQEKPPFDQALRQAQDAAQDEAGE